MNPPRTQPQRRLLLVGALADAHRQCRPGAILLQGERILATGFPQELGQPADAIVERLTDRLVIPALVNTHAHLDLSHVGPVEFDGDFTHWVDRLRANRAQTAEGVAEAVGLGVRLSRAGGTAAIGDIAGVRSLVPTQTQRTLGLAGVSFFEVFGVGRSQQQAVEVMRAAIAQTPALERGVMHGLQPHAPYSCGPEVFRAAARMDRPLATHLAETREELEFVDCATGPLAEMLKRLGAWDDSIAGFARHSIDHLADLVGRRRIVAAHVNYMDDAHLEVLARCAISVAYCPRASAYFGHIGHRYRDLLAAGVNVALGTDSILCLDTRDRISVLDEMRLLHRRDATDARTLLRMATINGARSLGMRTELFTLDAGESAGLLSLPFDARNDHDALSQALKDGAAPEWVVGPVEGRDGWFEPGSGTA